MPHARFVTASAYQCRPVLFPYSGYSIAEFYRKSMEKFVYFSIDGWVYMGIVVGMEEKAIASLIYWAPGVERDRVERWLKKLQEQGYIQSETTREYDSSIGEPVWYIP